jgi:hypothetical protein
MIIIHKKIVWSKQLSWLGVISPIHIREINSLSIFRMIVKLLI